METTRWTLIGLLVGAAALMLATREGFDDPKKGSDGPKKGKPQKKPLTPLGLSAMLAERTKLTDEIVPTLPPEQRAKVQAYRKFLRELIEENDKAIDAYFATTAPPDLRKIREERKRKVTPLEPEKRQAYFAEVDKARKAAMKCRPKLWFGDDFDPSKHTYANRTEWPKGSGRWTCNVPKKAGGTDDDYYDTGCSWGDGENEQRQCLKGQWKMLPLKEKMVFKYFDLPNA